MIKKDFEVFECPIRVLGKKDAHHFFGYYNKSPWHQTRNIVLANRYHLIEDVYTPEKILKVGYFNLDEGGEFVEIGKTTTWNWQMGCQLQWISTREVIFNVRSEGSSSPYPSFNSKIVNIDTKSEKILDIPIYSVAPSGEWALSVDYRRLFVTHETIGYSEFTGKALDLSLYPDDDGLRFVDLETGESKLIVSYKQLSDFEHRDSMDKAIHWISHIEINPDSNRILFLHRWTERVEDETCFLHRLITINPDGSEIRLLECSDHPLPQLSDDFDPNSVGTFDYEKSEYQISHPFWKNSDQIIVWGPHEGEIHYHLYEDKKDGSVKIIGDGILKENGHMSYSPVNGRWMLTDTYPDSDTWIRKLIMFDTKNNIGYEIGAFHTPDFKKEHRCDLHPRWNREGSKVCIDSVHEGERQMYEIDVEKLLNEKN